ncbi:MAG TPA: hypothetical protein PLH57_00850 [Oligoflexia bacterium]|nr:hypothetical protein [Oligoflexia bacterium]
MSKNLTRYKGFSTLELVISAAVVSAIALGASSIISGLEKAQRNAQAKKTRMEIVKFLAKNLSDPAAIMNSSEATTSDGNTNLKKCLYDDGGTADDCHQVPPGMTPIGGGVIIQPPPGGGVLQGAFNFSIFPAAYGLAIGGTPPPIGGSGPIVIDPGTNPTATPSPAPTPTPTPTPVPLPVAPYFFELRDKHNNFVHSPGYMYWTINGVPCTGTNGYPAYNAQSCPIRSSVGVIAACNDNINTTARCEIAKSFKFYYIVESNSATVGNTNTITQYSSNASDPVIMTTEFLRKTAIYVSQNCDMNAGQIVSGVSGGGTVTCAKPPFQKTYIARHSHSRSSPNCTFNVKRSGATTTVPTTFPQMFTDTRYSYLGSFMSPGVGTKIDLGKSGSCAKVEADSDDRFARNQMTECSSDLSCTDQTWDDYTLWLIAGRDAFSGNNGSSASVTGVRHNVSKCTECEIPGPVLVQHSMASHYAPECPTGYHRLWTGLSFGALSAKEETDQAGYSVRQDLSSPGSCFEMGEADVRPSQFLECDAESIVCRYRTNYDYAMWFSSINENTNAISFDRCSVCYKEPTVTPPLNLIIVGVIATPTPTAAPIAPIGGSLILMGP